jgi:hypothetical protein
MSQEKSFSFQLIASRDFQVFPINYFISLEEFFKGLKAHIGFGLG